MRQAWHDATPEAAPRARLRAAVAWAALAACIVGLAWLTLTPEPLEPVASLRPWCLVCGTGAGADAGANVVLFVPIGAALVAVGASWRRAALLCLLMSASIETAQFLVVPGRVASSADILTNTAGGAIGAAIATAWRTWLLPTTAAARRLFLATAALWLAILAFGAWGFSADPGDGPAMPAPSSLPNPQGYGWFEGRVHRATIDGWTVTQRGTGPVLVSMRVGPRVVASVEAEGRDSRDGFVPMLYVHGPDSAGRFLLGQSGADARLEVRTRGAWLRLLRPRVRIFGVLASEASRAPYTITGRLAGPAMEIEFTRDATTRRHRIDLGPTLAWALVSPVPAIDSAAAALATAAWLVVIAAALGYWAAWAATGRAALPGWLASALAVLATGLAAIPPLASFAPVGVADWASVVAGLALGAAAGVRARHAGKTATERAARRSPVRVH